MTLSLVLASGSPSRLSILRQAGIEPVVHPADVDEDAILASCFGLPAEVTLVALARAKAEAVAGEHPEETVVGADSMLLLDGQLHGKPHTVTETINRWQQQRGATAQLITGHCIITPNGVYTEAAATTVEFADASDADIAAYAATGEPLECAGAFTLEALGGWFIDRIDGDPSNVIGLSLPVVRRGLYRCGYSVHDYWNITSNS